MNLLPSGGSMKVSLAVCFLFFGALCAHANGNPPQQDSAGQQAPQNQTPPAASSDAAPAQAKIDPVKAADIQRLLEVAGTKALMTETLSAMEANVRPSLVKSL